MTSLLQTVKDNQKYHPQDPARYDEEAWDILLEQKEEELYELRVTDISDKLSLDQRERLENIIRDLAESELMKEVEAYDPSEELIP